MIECREILISDHIDQMHTMMIDHWFELGSYPDKVPLKPDFESVLLLEDAGKLLSIGVFAGEILVGYSVNILAPWLHSSDVLMCQNAVLWLDACYRRGTNGVRLIRETERAAKAKGCELFLCGTKSDTTLFELLPKLKYEVHETVYSRVLS